MQLGQAGAVGRRFGLAFELREFGLQLAQGGVAVDRVFDRSAVERRRFLRHIGHAPFGREIDLSLIRTQFAAQQAKQAGLAGPVGADQTDLVDGIERGGRALQQRLGAAHETELLKSDHLPPCLRSFLACLASCSSVTSHTMSSPALVVSQVSSSSGKAASACSRSLAISTIKTPFLFYRAAAPASMPSTRAMPSLPPAKAMRGSRRYSCGNASIDAELT